MFLAFIFLGVFLLVYITPLFICILLDLRRSAPFRRALSEWRFKWLAYAIPFGPALVVLLSEKGVQFPGIPAGAGFLSIFLTSIVSAAFAACWLCIPDDPARRIRVGYAIALTFVLWLLDGLAINAVMEMNH